MNACLTDATSDDLAAFEAACPEEYADHERELLWKGWQLHRSATSATGTEAPAATPAPAANQAVAPEQRAEAQDSLCGQILRLRGAYEESDPEDYAAGYVAGHKDGLHSAANLVKKFLLQQPTQAADDERAAFMRVCEALGIQASVASHLDAAKIADELRQARATLAAQGAQQDDVAKLVREAKYDAYAELFQLFPKGRWHVASLLSHNWQITKVEFTARPSFKRSPLHTQEMVAELPPTMRDEKTPYQLAKEKA